MAAGGRRSPPDDGAYVRRPVRAQYLNSDGLRQSVADRVCLRLAAEDRELLGEREDRPRRERRPHQSAAARHDALGAERSELPEDHGQAHAVGHGGSGAGAERPPTRHSPVNRHTHQCAASRVQHLYGEGNGEV